MTFTRFHKWLSLAFCLTALSLTGGSAGANADVVKIDLTVQEKAWLAEHPVVRIGESSEFEPELIRNPDGSLSGTLPEFTALLEDRLGIRFEIVDDKWPEIFRRIKEKEIDVVGLMNRGVAAKMGLLTIDPPYNVLVTAFARKDRTFEISQDQDIEGRRVAFFGEIVFLKKHFEALGERVMPVAADSPLDALKLLLDGKADVMVGFNEDSYLLHKYSIREVEPVYTFKTLDSNTGTAVRPDAPLLASILSKGFNSISREERERILSKWTWMPEAQEGLVNLTAEEKAWLAAHPLLKLGYDIDWMPIEEADEAGRHVGLAADFFDLIAERLGITIERVAPREWSFMLESARKGKVDLLSAVVKTPKREAFLDFTEPYLTFPMVIVTGKDVTYLRELSELNNRKVGVVAGYATQDHLSSDYPAIELVPVNDVREGLMDVIHGRTFAFIDNLATISRIIAREGLSDVKISGETPYKFDLRIGVRKGEPLLTSVMQKALDSIGEEERAEIYNRWINVVFEHGFNYKLLWQILAVIAAVLAVILFWNRRLAREIRQRQQTEEQLRKANEAGKEIMQDLYYEIEERKIVEAQLRRLTVAVEQNPAAIVITDLHGTIEYVNPRFERSTGYAAKEVIGQNPRILKSGHQPDAFYKELWKTITSGESWQGKLLNRKKNGELYWESASISPIRDPEGKIVNYVGLKLDITAQKAAEEALKRSEASLARAQKIAHVGNWEWNIRDNELYWSDEIYRIFGIKPRQFEATYEAFVGFVHPDDRGMLQEAVQGALEGKSKYSLDHRIVLNDGTERVVHEEGAVEFDNERRPLRMMGTVHDITERKVQEERIRRQQIEEEVLNAILALSLEEMEFKELMDRCLEKLLSISFMPLQGTGAIFTADEAGKILTLVSERGLGKYLVRECARLPFGRCLCGRAAAGGEIIFVEAVDDSHDITYEGMMPHGHYCVPIKSPKGVIGLINLYCDEGCKRDEENIAFLESIAATMAGIIERKGIQDKLKESEKKYRDIISTTREGYWLLDMDKKTLDINDSLSAMLGYRREEMVGKSPTEFVDDENRKIFVDQTSRITTTEHRVYEITLRAKDGRDVPTIFHATTLKDKDGNPYGAFAFITDVSELKVIERNLRLARDVAEEATMLKDKFVSLVSHDLKNPLQRVLGYMDMLEESKDLDVNQKRMIREGIKACDEMTALINDVLKLSRIRGGRIAPEYTSVGLRALAEQALDSYRQQATGKGIGLFNEVPDGAATDADEKLLLEVLRNLVSNAVKFCRKGDRIRLFMPEGETTTIAVADTGVGISREKQKSLFNFEERTSTEGTEGEAGTGFGLPLCNDIVAAHHGRLDVESEPGKGSTFYVRLPAARPKGSG